MTNEDFLESLYLGKCDKQIKLGPHLIYILFPPLFPFFETLQSDRTFPLTLDYLHSSDFCKCGVFRKLKAWTMLLPSNLGPHTDIIQNFPPPPPLFSMTYIFIEHICVIPFRNQNNAAFMHMLIQVGPRKKKFTSFPPIPPLFFQWHTYSLNIYVWYLSGIRTM